MKSAILMSMSLLVILIAELVALFFITRTLTNRIYLLIFLLTRSKSIAMTVVMLLLFPGTVIHELAHLFTAEVLGVHTGKLTLTPEAVRGDLPAQTGEVQAGSVSVAKTDPFRKTIIGIAPLFAGLLAFSILSYWFPGFSTGLESVPANRWLSTTTFYLVIGTLYLLFAISNSLFPSSLDLKGTPATFITLGIVLTASYVAGLRISLSGQAFNLTNRILSSLTQSAMLVLALNTGLLLIVWFLIALSGKVLRRKIR